MLTVTLFRDARDVLPQPREVTVAQLCDLLAPAVPPVRRDLVEEARRKVGLVEAVLNTVQQGLPPRPWMQNHAWYRALEQIAWVQGDREPAVREAMINGKAVEIVDGIQKQMKTALPCWSPAIYAPRATRGIAGVVAVSCLVLDYDDGTEPEDALGPWEEVTALLHTTWSHTASRPRFRVVLPLAEPVAASEWSGVWRWARDRAVGEIDPACKDPSRLYFLPALAGAKRPYMRRVLNPRGPLLVPGAAPRRAVGRVTAGGASEAREEFKNSQEAREQAAAMLGATVRGDRAEDVVCPKCQRRSVWFWLPPGEQSTARCQHKKTCGWWGHLDELLGQGMHRARE